jgi:hypothetical protein
LKFFLRSIWRNQPYGNVQEALHYLESIEEVGTYSFTQFNQLRTKYPNIFYPVYELQIKMISESLGENWWENHKANLHDLKQLAKEKQLADAQRQRKEQEKQANQVNEEIVKKKMGIKYYLMPWTIPYERKKLAKIAAIEEELEQQFNELKRDR